MEHARADGERASGERESGSRRQGHDGRHAARERLAETVRGSESSSARATTRGVEITPSRTARRDETRRPNIHIQYTRSRVLLYYYYSTQT
eukprot:scaffold27147_cov30-Tisochrysis_lutea.AAC.1